MSSLTEGGAGLAALRLHRSLLDDTSISSTFLSLYPPREPTARCVVARRLRHKVVDRLASGLYGITGAALTEATRQRRRLARFQGKYEYFSFPTSRYRLHGMDVVRRADIVHLHWLAGLLDYPTFFRGLEGQRVVWTLHDMNLMLGGFHYRGDFDRSDESLKALDLELRRVKEKAFAGTPMTLVCPSRWMADQARESLGNHRIEVVENGIDTEIFDFGPRERARRALQLPTDRPIVLFVSESLDNYRKGQDVLLGGVEDRSLPSEILFVMVGRSNESVRSPRVRQFGLVTDDATMARLYQAADVFALPSREDNLPNVMLESLCCGCPVVAHETGGMVDVIDSSCGLLVEGVSSATFARAIAELLRRAETLDRRSISETARRRFSLRRLADEMGPLYASVAGAP